MRKGTNLNQIFEWPVTLRCCLYLFFSDVCAKRIDFLVGLIRECTNKDRCSFLVVQPLREGGGNPLTNKNFLVVRPLREGGKKRKYNTHLLTNNIVWIYIF